MIFRALLLCTMASTALAAINEPCYGPDGVAGVCIDASTCRSGGGSPIGGACPKDPGNIQCCSKTQCDSGNCRWASDCSGQTASNQCPGPAAFKCCSSSDTGFGGYDTPRMPAIGACKANAVSSAQTIVDAWPGRIRDVQCIRDGCACTPSPSSDHCCGLATDLFVSDTPGIASLSGREIAEWVMNNSDVLGVKYIIWGQRIWDDDNARSWDQWTPMEDRGSPQKNHWDHVHVSYNAQSPQLELL